MADIDFNCRLDAGEGRDPDSHSPTLRRYHQLLWSKALPNGAAFSLDTSGPKPFLVHRSDLGEFHLTSDSITHRYASRPKLAPLLTHLPEDARAWVDANAWLIYECILFPGRKRDGKATINGARGMNQRIGDRFDLTLECIRRHYAGSPSPLGEVLARYADFFDLFGDFQGYVEFFLLQDLVTSDYKSVNFYLPFDDFVSDPVPGDLESYVTYLRSVVRFSCGRRERVARWFRTDSSR